MNGEEVLLEKYISRLIRVTTTDNRAFFGSLICTDRDLNLILQDTTERRTDLRRYIGMVVIPGKLIGTIALQKL
jgi:small nuclear ribonucleoprotein (snRNP)-like protein